MLNTAADHKNVALNWEKQLVCSSSGFCARAATATRPYSFYGLRPRHVAMQIARLDADPAQTSPEATVIVQVAAAVAALGGRLLIVGGYVRDALLGLQSKDYDVEIFGLSAEQLKSVLVNSSPTQTLDCVGESFGVFMLHGLNIDWALPRRDSKMGRGHRDIAVACDPHLSYREAAQRRDLTVNALLWDPLSLEIIDPFHGLDDLRSGTLRAVDAALFGDDPLRGLRAVRMAALFGFLPDAELLQIMAQQDLSALSSERLWGEWEKIALKARLPSLAFLCLEDSGLIRYFPELDALRDVRQEAEWHPEGDVYVHTAMVCDAAVALRNGEREHDLGLFFSAVCHDLGKAPTTVFEDGRWRSKMHDVAGIDLSKIFLKRIHSPHKLITQVCSLVEHHLRPVSLIKGYAGPAAYRRLARKCADSHVSLQLLAELAEADHRGRTTADAGLARIDYIHEFYERIEELALQQQAPEPLVQGRHLLNEGYKPGPHLGKLLQRCFDYQLESGADDIAAIMQAALKHNQK